jgi:hypothetical protein
VVQEVHEIRECQGPHPSLGPLLSCVQTDLQAAAPGRIFRLPAELTILLPVNFLYSSLFHFYPQTLEQVIACSNPMKNN